MRQESSVNINAAPPGGGNAGRLLNTTFSANTNNTDLNALQPFRGSNYHGLQTQLTRMNPKKISTSVSGSNPTTSAQLGSFGEITSSNVNRSLRLSGRVTFLRST